MKPTNKKQRIFTKIHIRMVNEIKKCLEAQNWIYSEVVAHQHHQLIQLQVQGANGLINVVVDVCEKEVMVVAICPIHAPTAALPAMAELLTRINYQMLLGNFDMDFDDGEIRFKISWCYDTSTPILNPTVERNLLTCVEILDYYLPAVMKVCYGNSLPIVALATLQQQSVPMLN